MDAKDYYFLFRRPEDPENKHKAPVFDNEVLNRLTVTSPLIAFISYIPLVAGLLAYNHYQRILEGVAAFALLAAGVFSWTIAEYFIHRFFYHTNFRNPIIRRVQLLIHGFHHKHPQDRGHLFMPFFGGYPAIFLFWLLFYLLLGRLSFLFLAGFLIGYLSYVYLHYIIHRFKPPAKWLVPLWRHHLLHHYKYPEHAFGFLTTLWDRVFGTMPPGEAAEKKPE